MNGTPPNSIGILLTLGFFTVCLMFFIKQAFGTASFKRLAASFNRLPRAMQITVLAITAVGIVVGGSKPESNPSRFMDVTQLPSGTSVQIVDDVAFSEGDIALKKVLSGVSIDENLDLSAPTNAVVHERWRLRGAAEDGFWTGLPDPFMLGTNAYDAVYVSSSGTLSFGRRKGSPTARLMSDGSDIAFLAPLHTVLGIPPEAQWDLMANHELGITNSLFWHDVTDSRSSRFTWQNVLLGRETNAPVSFQVELFPDGDFIYRYDFNAPLSNILTETTEYVIGAQGEPGAGKTALINTQLHACSGTNHLCGTIYGLDGTNFVSAPLCEMVADVPTFALHWTDINDLDLSISDPDEDGLTSAEEVLVYHTDPLNADSDFDGLSDGDEVMLGMNPLNPDEDGDGIPDGDDPNPFVWDDAESDASGDGMSLADALLNGLDPSVNNAVDTDGDGWFDWKEVMAGTSPTDAWDTPDNADGSTKIFDVTIASKTALDTPVLVSVGGYRMVFGGTPTSRTVTLREGVAYPVTLFAAEDCTVSLTVTLDSSFAGFSNPHPVFSGDGTLAGGRATSSGMIALPVLTIVPARICFHTTNDKYVEAVVTPKFPGSYLWDSDEDLLGVTESAVSLDYFSGETWLSVEFLAEGATSSRWVSRNISRCNLIDEHPGWLEGPPPDPYLDPPDYYEEEDDPFTGEFGIDSPDSQTGAITGTLVPVNNDDDDASGMLDMYDTNMSIPDNDLVAFYPIGRFSGACCPCPEHALKFVNAAKLDSKSYNLSLWEDACKSNEFSGTLNAGTKLYVEGRFKSGSVGGDKLIWKDVDSSQTHTNIFTVLSQRIFADLDFDGDVDLADKALHPSLSPAFGWVMPVDTHAFRKLQLQTDISLPGTFTLSLSGDNAFRVWQSENPSSTNTPILVSGRTVVNGVNDISWNTSSTANLYIQAVNSGTAILTYSFVGTDEAEGIRSRASLKMTACGVEIVMPTDTSHLPYAPVYGTVSGKNGCLLHFPNHNKVASIFPFDYGVSTKVVLSLSIKEEMLPNLLSTGLEHQTTYGS